ncbi:HlyD family efflux transporter periplasmic adaptor subunit [Candidatus Nomurabacteria bacterium]|nr:HlyD family efflux transporter periplasmic adaptor subunit [Candidatus Nomurabacteria bacterium]
MKNSPLIRSFSRPIVQSVTGIAVAVLLLAGALLYKSFNARISIDRARIEAPVIAIGPETSGVLEEVYVHPGDTVSVGQNLARVGSEVLSAKVAGIVLEASNTPGQVFAPSQVVVKMIEPTELRVVGVIKENEGLSSLAAGNPVRFTVDTFEGESFVGVVERISPTSQDTGVVFSISDKREVKEFEVTVRYDTAAHPEFKNGMSAKMNVYIK